MVEKDTQLDDVLESLASFAPPPPSLQVDLESCTPILPNDMPRPPVAPPIADSDKVVKKLRTGYKSSSELLMELHGIRDGMNMFDYYTERNEAMAPKTTSVKDVFEEIRSTVGSGIGVGRDDVIEATKSGVDHYLSDRVDEVFDGGRNQVHDIMSVCENMALCSATAGVFNTGSLRNINDNLEDTFTTQLRERFQWRLHGVGERTKGRVNDILPDRYTFADTEIAGQSVSFFYQHRMYASDAAFFSPMTYSDEGEAFVNDLTGTGKSRHVVGMSVKDESGDEYSVCYATGGSVYARSGSGDLFVTTCHSVLDGKANVSTFTDVANPTQTALTTFRYGSRDNVEGVSYSAGVIDGRAGVYSASTRKISQERTLNTIVGYNEDGMVGRVDFRHAAPGNDVMTSMEFTEHHARLNADAFVHMDDMVAIFGSHIGTNGAAIKGALRYDSEDGHTRLETGFEAGVDKHKNTLIAGQIGLHHEF